MRTLAAVAVLMLVVGCQAPQQDEMTAGEHEAIVKAIMDQSDAMIARWNSTDVGASMAFHHPEKTAVAWSGTVYDYQSLPERWDYVWGNYTAQESHWTDRRIDVFSEEAAVFQGHFDLTLTREDGSKINYPGNCIWTAVFELYNGDWLMTYASYTWGAYEVVEEG